MRNFYLLLFAIVFISGIISASLGVFVYFPPGFLALFIAILFIPFVFLRKNNALFITFLLLVVFLLGAMRYGVYNRSGFLMDSRLRGNDILLQGRVASDPEESPAGKKTSFTLESHALKDRDNVRQVRGFILINAYNTKDIDYKYGDIVVVEGVLKEPVSYYTGRQRFDYRKYLANKRIYAVLNVKKGSFSEIIGEDTSLATQIVRGIYSVRGKLESHIKDYFDPPYDSILMALLLGKRRSIGRGLTDVFAKTGTLHILAISGLHVGIIYFVLRTILRILRAGRNLSIILSVAFLACFAIMTGARPSILRAATMFSILGAGEILRRRTGILNLMGLSALIILMVNPNQVFDSGFVLSYAAVLSIIVISPLLSRQFQARGILWKTILVSLAVYIGLFPLIMYYFGLITPVVVIANLLVLPLLILTMGSGILFVTLGLASRMLAIIFSQSAWLFLVVLVNGVKWLKKLPFAYFEVEPPHLWAVLGYYIAGFFILKLTWRFFCVKMTKY